MVFSGLRVVRSGPCEQAGGWPLSTPVEVVGQGAESAVPVAGQRGQELLRHLHRRQPQPVAHPAPLSRLGRYQAGLGQQGQMLGYCLPG